MTTEPLTPQTDSADATYRACGRIPVRNVWYMLLYAWELARFCGRADLEREPSPDLVALLARVLVEVTRDLLRRGLHRDYVERVTSIRHLRGRVDVAETIRHLELVHGRVTCRFDELDPDFLPNRILRTTLLRLCESPGLRIEAEGHPALHDELVDLYRRLEGIATLPALRHEHFGLVRVSRNNAFYRLVMEICQLLADRRLPTQRTGSDPFLGLLEDEIAMSRVFEEFVRNFYRMHCPGYKEVGSEILKWPVECDGYGLLPVMRTDVSLASPTRRIVIETKYYSQTLTRRYDRSTIHSSNLYQLYAYLRTQEGMGPLYESAEGILLYPAVDTHLQEVYRIQGHTIRVATVDLDQPWAAIEKGLLNLVLHDASGSQ